jgi:hypothetical protein
MTEEVFDAVLVASESLIQSKKFRKVLEIMMAFGNYMNSSRRGVTYGFKLESFSRFLDTRSADKAQTLFHYIVQSVNDKFPDVKGWMDDLHQIFEAANVSMITLASDVQTLRKGIDMVLYEREKQQNNFIIYTFYTSAVHKVARLTEKFKTMEDSYSRVCELFDENPKMIEPFEFFSFFRDFIKQWKICETENKKRLKKSEPLPFVPKVITSDKNFKAVKIEGDQPAHPLLGTTSKVLRS